MSTPTPGQLGHWSPPNIQGTLGQPLCQGTGLLMRGVLGDILPQIPGFESWKVRFLPVLAWADTKDPGELFQGKNNMQLLPHWGRGHAPGLGGVWAPGLQEVKLPPSFTWSPQPLCCPVQHHSCTYPCSSSFSWLLSLWAMAGLLHSLPTRLRPALRVMALRASCAQWCLCPSLFC